MEPVAPPLWDALRDTAVRDLCWLLASGDLLAESPAAALARPWATAADAARITSWLAALDARPEPLHRELASAAPARVGRYAECLLGYFAAHAPGRRLIAANMPLRSNGRTLGECDFLIETERGERLHWELAVKCYLRIPRSDDAAALADFVGPNLIDRFDRKCTRLIDHQLTITHRDAFASLGLGAHWMPQMFVKGWLFYPPSASYVDLSARKMTIESAVEPWIEPVVVSSAGSAIEPAIRSEIRPQITPRIRPAHPHGFWITQAAWAGCSRARAQSDDVAWIVLPRLSWLAPRRIDVSAGMAEDAASGAYIDLGARACFARSAQTSVPDVGAALDTVCGPVSRRAVLAYAGARPAPVLIASLTREAGAWREISRGFIVADDWPARALAFAAR